MRLLLVIAIAGFLTAFAASVALGHDRNDCEGRYHEDVNNGPAGRYWLYVETSHDNLFVRAGSGVSSISVSSANEVIDGVNTFEYGDTTIELPANSNVHRISYRTTRSGAIVLICFDNDLGLWSPIPPGGSQPPPPPPPPAAPCRRTASAYAKAHPGVHAYSKADALSDGHAHADAPSYGGSDAPTHSSIHSEAHPGDYPYAGTHSRAYPGAYAHAYARTHADANAGTHPHPYAGTDSYAYPRTYA